MTAVLEPPSTDLPDPGLSLREREVLRAWVLADSKEEVGQQLFIAESTVNTHIARIRTKYEAVGRPATTKAALLARALQDGIVDLDQL
ncbi:MAG: LuxR family transcriptional regulator [Williamsia herbipolensis]|uniref:DNA-binding transcriptional regulator, CsgD family n=1 Tax=Williamsia serinedens TaxID=391736 RepID=A0ABT1H3R4_9NOCA|nr:LuxR C-terminal-related transcriptional regulator [Williamsia serinedens]MBE7162592.1 LuxR family transcriptional regulator [Williamsia herbipolensis]MCP2161870.1 DNA-binding transcriptional regulator, CsgD family [Williamsia serinedens]